MIRKMALLVIAMVLGGCASTATVKLDRNVSPSMHGRTLAVSTSDKPDFAAMTAGKAMFALVGAFAMISTGNEIIRKYDVEDPATYIGNEIAMEIARTRSMDLISPAIPSKEDSIEYLSRTHAGNDYVLDVRTINWSFGYFPTDWNNYRVMYSAKARLLDMRSRETIAEAFCSRVPERSSTSPSYDQLLSKNAARLKSELQVAAKHCVKELRDKLL